MLSKNKNFTSPKSSFYRKSFDFLGSKIIIETNQLARLTDKSFLVRWNDTTVLATVCVDANVSTKNWMPLTVEFQESLSAVGRIPGSFFRREGKPSDTAILNARVIDRSIRNFFPVNFRHETQVIVQPLSVDYSVDLRTVSVFATSLALNCSSLPFDIPVAGFSVGNNNDNLVLNPDSKTMETSDLNMFVAGSAEKISMLEIGANQLSEEKIIKAITLAQKNITKLLKIVTSVTADQKLSPKDYVVANTEKKFADFVQERYHEKIKKICQIQNNLSRNEEKNNLWNEILRDCEKEVEEFSPQETDIWFENAFKKLVRQQIVEKKIRLDGRSFNEIRPLEIDIDILPIVHGSALFSRGLTQTLSTVTLGSVVENQFIDDLTKEKTHSFLHHYKALPFSYGQVGPIRGVSRRETGHGFIGQKALKWVLPTIDKFPYTIRVLSEVMSSNGSTSQASICSASLALMSAGVPIKSHLAGTATGLVFDGENYHLLSDIQAWEDFYGDMDFKIAGTETGVCAVQVDLKIAGLPLPIIEKIFLQAKKDRQTILQKMTAKISHPKSQLAASALKFAKTKIDVKDISYVIGPSGKNIKKLIIDCDDAKIDVQDDGTIFIYHTQKEMIDKALKLITQIISAPTKTGSNNNGIRAIIPKLGTKLEGKVTKIAEYGAFVKLPKVNNSGLLHISALNKKRFIKDIRSELNEDDKVLVEVSKINEHNQIGLKLIKKRT